MKAALLRLAYRIGITLVLVLAIPVVLFGALVDILIALASALATAANYAIVEIGEDWRIVRVETVRVYRAFVEAFRRGQP